jgi:hypothetical protein
MAVAELIASGTTLANSSDVTLASGEAASVFLADAAGPGLPADARAEIQYKSNGGQYFPVGGYLGIITAQSPITRVDGPLVFRVQRFACSAAITVERY